MSFYLFLSLNCIRRMQNIRHTDNRFIMEWEQDYVIAFIEACQQIYGIIKQKTVGTNT